jgi:hypothetical protein
MKNNKHRFRLAYCTLLAAFTGGSSVAVADSTTVAWLRGYLTGTCSPSKGYTGFFLQTDCTSQAYSASHGPAAEFVEFQRLVQPMLAEVQAGRLTDDEARVRLDQALAALEQREKDNDKTEQEHGAKEFGRIHAIFIDDCNFRHYDTLHAQIKCTDVAYRKVSQEGPELRLFDRLAAGLEGDAHQWGAVRGSDYNARIALAELLDRVHRALDAGAWVDGPVADWRAETISQFGAATPQQQQQERQPAMAADREQQMGDQQADLPEQAAAVRNRQIGLCVSAMLLRPTVTGSSEAWSNAALCRLDPQSALKIPPPSPTPPPSPPAGGGGVSGPAFYRGEQRSGFNKICLYDRLGSAVAITVGAAEICPQVLQ